MISFAISIQESFRQLEETAKKAQFRNNEHAAASIRKDAAASIVTADGPSPPGSPPHTHRRAFLRRAIRFESAGDSFVIGPRESIVGTSGAASEFGGTYKSDQFDARPFMAPALSRAIPRLAGSYRGSIGN